MQFLIRLNKQHTASPAALAENLEVFLYLLADKHCNLSLFVIVVVVVDSDPFMVGIFVCSSFPRLFFSPLTVPVLLCHWEHWKDSPAWLSVLFKIGKGPKQRGSEKIADFMASLTSNKAKLKLLSTKLRYKIQIFLCTPMKWKPSVSLYFQLSIFLLLFPFPLIVLTEQAAISRHAESESVTTTIIGHVSVNWAISPPRKASESPTPFNVGLSSPAVMGWRKPRNVRNPPRPGAEAGPLRSFLCYLQINIVKLWHFTFFFCL